MIEGPFSSSRRLTSAKLSRFRSIAPSNSSRLVFFLLQLFLFLLFLLNLIFFLFLLWILRFLLFLLLYLFLLSSRYIRFIYNRVILENAPVRAAAVAALAKFGATSADILPSILVLLRRCTLDTDDEVRDRATFYYQV